MLVRNFKLNILVNLNFRAVQSDGRNPVYYCNRAAAYSKLDNNSKAIEDCDTAILLDPKYSKAYGRKGYVLVAASTQRNKTNLECREASLIFICFWNAELDIRSIFGVFSEKAENSLILERG